MKYARSLKKAAIGKRILLSWLIVGSISLVVGLVLGLIIANL